MAKEKTYILQALNISLIDHSKEKYIELFSKIGKICEPIKLRGSRYVLPGEFKKYDDELIFGYFYKFTKIDENSTWIDVKSIKEIVDEEGKPVQLSPKNKHPNTKHINFIFSTKDHRLIFIKDEMSAQTMLGLFEKIMDYLGVFDISINIEQSPDSIDKILKLQRITNLTIFICVPNPDDLGGVDVKMEERLKSIGANKFKEEYIGQDIKPNQEIQNNMNLASSNGYVKAIGTNQFGERVELKTTDENPMSIKLKYTKTSDLNFWDAFAIRYRDFIKFIKNKIAQ